MDIPAAGFGRVFIQTFFSGKGFGTAQIRRAERVRRCGNRQVQGFETARADQG